MSRRLIEQGEADRPDEGGRWFGVEMFHDEAEDFWTARFHCRIYDGIRVASSHTTDEVRLDGATEQEARAALREQWRVFVGLYR